MSKANTKDGTRPKLCFVIGPIGDPGSLTRRHADMLLNAIIRPTIEPLGYMVKRADEDPTPGMISDSMLIDLRDAELVVADLSELNPNAFYELGIRHARMKPTIHMAIEGLRLPFDNAGYRAVRFDLSDWHSHQQCRNTLEQAVRATEAPDFKVSNPLTYANAIFEVRDTSDPGSAVLGEILSRVSRLERSASPHSSFNYIFPYNPAEGGGTLTSDLQKDLDHVMINLRNVVIPDERAIMLIKSVLDRHKVLVYKGRYDDGAFNFDTSLGPISLLR
jgi:hypothetical protein